MTPYGITMGDSSGIGPEVLLRCFRDGTLRFPVVAFGDLEALAYYNELLSYGVELRKIAKRRPTTSPGPLNVIDAGIMWRAEITPGQLSRKSGEAARAYVVAATHAALGGEIAAIVTLPMNKEATQLSDPNFVGHTELIGNLCGVEDVTIMLASDQLIVTHVTTHCLPEDRHRARQKGAHLHHPAAHQRCRLQTAAERPHRGRRAESARRRERTLRRRRDPRDPPRRGMGEKPGHAGGGSVSARHRLLHGRAQEEIRRHRLHVS